MFKKYFHTTTSKVILLFLILIALQWFPYTGIFLMFTASALWVGYMPHIIVLAIIYDVYKKQIPTYILLIPLFLIVGYYTLYFAENPKIAIVENELKAENPTILLKYDDNLHYIISDYDSEELVKRYKIPAVFKPSKGNVYTSYRIVTRQLCDELREKNVSSLDGFYHATNMYWEDYFNPANNRAWRNLCVVTMPEQIPEHKKSISMDSTDLESNNEKVHKGINTFFLDGEKIGEYISASYTRLPVFPKFAIGCGLNSSAASWDCIFDFRYTRQQLDTYPGNFNRDKFKNTAISLMLNIEKYQESDLENLTDNPETKEILDKLIEIKSNETPDDFDKWGIRKDSIYSPNIYSIGEINAFEGTIGNFNNGLPFNEFIKENMGSVVFIKANMGSTVWENGFYTRICDNKHECENTGYTVHNNGDSSYVYNDNDTGTIEGYWKISKKEIVPYDRKSVPNTIELTGVSSQEVFDFTNQEDLLQHITNKKLQEESDKILKKYKPLILNTSNSLLSFKNYINEEIGIYFEYPDIFKEVDIDIRNGITGRKFYGIFEFFSGNTIYLSGMTKDYTGEYERISVLDTNKYTQKSISSYIDSSYKYIDDTFEPWKCNGESRCASVIKNTYAHPILTEDQIAVFIFIPYSQNKDFSNLTFLLTPTENDTNVSEAEIEALRSIVTSIKLERPDGY
ncbi:MAG: hypothetical protein R3B60_02955 [Candidatus Paceibacterota bacterium]